MKQSESTGPWSRSRLWLAQTNRQVLDRLGQTQESIADLDPLDLLPLDFLDAQGRRLWQWVTPEGMAVDGAGPARSGQRPLRLPELLPDADGFDASVIDEDVPAEARDLARRAALLLRPVAAPPSFRSALGESLQLAAAGRMPGEDDFVELVTSADKNVLLISLGKVSPWTVVAGVPVMVGIAAYVWRRISQTHTEAV